MRVPSGDQAAAVFRVGSAPALTGEMATRSVPSGSATQIWNPVGSEPCHAIRVPSGDQTGSELLVGSEPAPTLEITRRFEPSVLET